MPLLADGRGSPRSIRLSLTLSLSLSRLGRPARAVRLFAEGALPFAAKRGFIFFQKKPPFMVHPFTDLVHPQRARSFRRPTNSHPGGQERSTGLRVRRAAAMSRFGFGLARRLAFGVSSSRSASCAGQPLCGSSPAAQALGGALSVGLGDGEALFYIAPTLVQTRGFAVPKRKVSRSKKGMKENHPSKRIRSKKTYSYCEKCDEVLGPHQICSGILKGTCTCSSLLKPAHGAAGN